jgi:hypothetical protein
VREVRVGMHVRGADHARLGRVLRIEPHGFVVKKRVGHQYAVQKAEIVRVEGDTVVVAQHRPEVAEASGVVHKVRRRAARRA